jgi:hypothetical protein
MTKPNEIAKTKPLRPRNQTARYVVGNPVTTRMEAGVANCFPGLEFDVRNLDRRFFPGILFQFIVVPLYAVPTAPPNQRGARVLYLDFLEDPMLPPASKERWVQNLLTTYNADFGTSVWKGDHWYIDWLEQGGKRHYMHNDDMTPFDGLMVWRFVRSLLPDVPLSMGLVQRGGDASVPRGAVELKGFRRRYVTPAGVIDPAFRVGELTESMCNPWSHDFRDCACHYWASNHPDVVVASPGLVGDRDTLYLDWLREDRGVSGAASAAPTIDENRPYQIDHFWVNAHWQELPFVLGNRELTEPTYAPPPRDRAQPYPSAKAMIQELTTVLAPLELTLALEYLYALFSIHANGDATLPGAWATLSDDVQFARHYVQLVAVGEMTHLRWANQLLWELDRAGFYPPGTHYEPVLALARTIPERDRGPRPRALRPLSQDTLQDFIDAERPGAALDTAYARCVATLEQKEYPQHLFELAVRVDTDGVNHFQRYSDLQKALRAYPDEGDGSPWLRSPLRKAKPEEAREALGLRDQILEAIRRGYVAEAKDDAAGAEKAIVDARGAMARLIQVADALARDRGLGVPFFDEWPASPERGETGKDATSAKRTKR